MITYKIYKISIGLLSLIALNCFGLEGKPAFDKMKSLTGQWHIKSETTSQELTIYELTGGDSTLMERINNMITMYHLDGDRLMATHYCEAKNQPRLIAIPTPEENIIQFEFLDITNATPQDPHIHSARFVFIDNNHMTQHWTWFEKGKETGMDFELIKDSH